MASSVTMDLGGLRAYRAKLEAGRDAFAAKIAHDIEADAKQRAPVDTGALRNSIHAQQESPGVWVVSVGVAYAAPVEFGHVSRGGSHVPAHPYFTPAVESARATMPSVARVFFGT